MILLAKPLLSFIFICLITQACSSMTLCDDSCSTCAGTSANDCLTCADGYRAITDDHGSLSCVLVKFGGVSEESFWNAPMEPGTTTFVALFQTMQYVRFLDVKMSPRLQQLVRGSNRFPFTLMFGFGMPEGLKERFTKLDFDPLFERVGYHSSFFVNFWQAFTTFVIFLLSGGLAYIFELFFRRIEQKFLEQIAYRFRIIFTWNFIFMLHALIIGDIMIYASLEFETFASSDRDSHANFSLAVCVLVLIATFIFLVATTLLIIKVHRIATSTPSDSSKTNSESFMKKIEGMRALWDGFNNKNAYGRFFFLIYTVRVALQYLFALCFQKVPILQVSLQIVTNVFIVVSMFWKRPLPAPVLHYQVVVFEILVFLFNIPVLMMTIMDAAGVDNPDMLVVLGDIIIIGNFLLYVLLIAWISLKTFLAARKVLLARNKISQKDVALGLLEALAVPHQGQLCFELIYEIKNYDAIPVKPIAIDTEACEFPKFETQPTDASPSKIPFTNRHASESGISKIIFFPQSCQEMATLPGAKTTMNQLKLGENILEEQEELDPENIMCSPSVNRTNAKEKENTGTDKG